MSSKRLAISLLVVATFQLIRFEAHGSSFPCPDEHSFELLHKARAAQSDSDYAIVIEQASKRSMDERALFIACRNLATRTFRGNCSDYGYECPDPGTDLMGWPAQINDWIPQLKANVPALKLCPDIYIAGDPKLPILRFDPVVPRNIVEDGLTGSVTLRLDIDDTGDVTNAVVESSTSSRLEDSALEAARRFRYWPELKDGKHVAATNVRATILFSYSALAKAAGCSMPHD